MGRFYGLIYARRVRAKQAFRNNTTPHVDPSKAISVCGYVEDMKASGFVADALARHGIQGASVAPAQA